MMYNMNGPMIKRKEGETYVDAARRRLEMEYPKKWFNLVEEKPYSENIKGKYVEFFEISEWVLVVDE